MFIWKINVNDAETHFGPVSNASDKDSNRGVVCFEVEYVRISYGHEPPK